MFLRVGTPVTVLAILLIIVVCADAQDAALKANILHPIGTPSGPVHVKPSISTETTGLLPGLPITSSISFPDFMRRVEETNFALAAQRYNVPIAQAQLKAASVLPDPTFQAGYGGDVSGERQVTTYSGSLAQEFVLGGKIGYRKDAARAALAASAASLADYIRNLRVQAAETFIDGLTNQLKLRRQQKSVERAHQLVQLNIDRLNQGQASEDAVMRSRIAEVEAYSGLADTQSALHDSLASLAFLMGANDGVGLIAPLGDLENAGPTFSLEDLVHHAVTLRSDVVAAQYSLESARAGYRLAKAGRIPDVTVTGAYAHLTRVTDPIDPSPAWDSLGVFFSLPIPISALNAGAVQAAYYQALQADKAWQAARLQAESDVRKAYEHYVLASEQAQLFASELLKDSDRVYKSRLFKLVKGQVALVDVLDAHQALDQLYTDYYNALSGRAKALVELEQAAGIWDISF